MDDNNRKTKVALDDQTDDSIQEQLVERKKVDENVAQDVNMEASISSDDVIRAGGFGARDDINSFLPVASDSTDFEASLRDARVYEDPQEASISSDDVIRAGGFGARDDISSFLPVASDSTDFEASLRDAREYEDPQEEIKRPGLGWTESKK